ncbi:hypothetical protein BC827DRAFT_326438 [Russula dissimulans]|nr:hypothetical protein BC827DRAFT_326438 [Russula dissimulans]
MFRFGAFRKCCLVVIAIVSLFCISLSLSLYDDYQEKSDLGVLVTMPGLSLIASTIGVLTKQVFPSASVLTSVAVECIWTLCFVVFSLILSLYSLEVGTNIKSSTQSAHTAFLILEICCWSLTGLFATYSSLITFLSIFAAATVDKDVWFRDIAGSPSPFPVAASLYSTKLWLKGIRSTPSGMGDNTTEHLPHCLPRCSCKEKIPPSSPQMALPPLGMMSHRQLDGYANARSIVPGFRVPTALERHNSIFVGLDV